MSNRYKVDVSDELEALTPIRVMRTAICKSVRESGACADALCYKCTYFDGDVLPDDEDRKHIKEMFNKIVVDEVT